MKLSPSFIPLISFLLLAGVLWLSACETRYEVIDSGIEYCPESIDMGFFTPTELTRFRYPYADAPRRVIFSDSLGNEVAGTFGAINSSIVNFTMVETPCINDENYTLTIDGERERLSQDMSIEGQGVVFAFDQLVVIDGENYEKEYSYDLVKIVMEYFDPNTEQDVRLHLNVLIDQRNTPVDEIKTNFKAPIGDWSIHGKVYEQVFSFDGISTATECTPKYYYNHNEGIVAFEDPATKILYKFERFEY